MNQITDWIRIKLNIILSLTRIKSFWHQVQIHFCLVKFYSIIYNKSFIPIRLYYVGHICLKHNVDNQGWTNTNTYRANTGVRSCSPEHERTRTRIFQKLLNTNEHELGKVINYRTRTNTNTKLKVDEQRTRDRTWNTWSNTEHVIEYWIYDKYQM